MSWKGTSRNRTRGRKWMATIARIKRRDKVCRQCVRDGTVTKDSRIWQIGHIIPLFEGGTDEDENLEGECERHAKAKTAAESARAQGRNPPRQRVPIGTDGWPID